MPVITYIDAHAHLNSPQFEPDREAVWQKTLATVGFHPTDQTEEIDWTEFETLAGGKEVVAIGECGLDLYRFEGDSTTELARQTKIFERQIDLAVRLGKPLVIHIREAYEPAYEILKKKKAEAGEKLSFDLHFFSGTADWVEKFSALDAYFSFAGPITFTEQYDEAIARVPADRLMAETDSPFASPVPYRGKRCEPAYVKFVAEKLLALRGWSAEEGLARLKANTERFYKIGVV